MIVRNTPATPPQPEHDSSTLATFNMDDYRQCRQAEALRWINLQEKRSSIISRLQPVSAEEYQRLHNLVLSKPGPLLRKSKKKTGLKYAALIDLLS